MQKQGIKTLEEAEQALKQTPYLYLISFVDIQGRPGSTIIGMKEDAPLYKPYFIFNEVNKDKQVLTILHIVKLTDDEIIVSGIEDKLRPQIRKWIDAFEETWGYFDWSPSDKKAAKALIEQLKEML